VVDEMGEERIEPRSPVETVEMHPPPPVAVSDEGRTGRSGRTLRRLLAGATTVVLIVGGRLAFLAATGSDVVPSDGSRDVASTGSAAYHRAHPAEGETAALAALLVDVPRYAYVDATRLEVDMARAQLDPVPFAGVSLHSVVVGGETEVAFLQLYEWQPDVISPDLPDSSVVPVLMGTPATSQMIVGDQEVFLFEDPAHPASRYTFVWLMDGKLAAADAGDRALLSRWVHAYLSLLAS
jgi:hypothetical protein